MKRRIGITLGEPLGIGPEIIAKTLAKGLPENVQCFLYGSARLMERTGEMLNIPRFWSMDKEGGEEPIVFRTCGPDPAEQGFGDKGARAEAVLRSIDSAATDATEGKIDALVTAPIDKGVVREIIPQFTGHTGYLARLAGVERTRMLLDNTELRVLLLTEHIPLRDVSRSLTIEDVVATTELAVEAFGKWFSIPRPHIAVAGINPHAGEITPEPEEKTILFPAIAQLRERGINIEGPFAADSLFPKARTGPWDLILSAYHDQGLIAAKYPGLEKVVNITLGLPYLRISPGHGVAYDIVGKNVADPRSFERALRIAMTGRLVP